MAKIRQMLNIRKDTRVLNSTTPWKKVWHLNTHLSYDPVLLDIYPGETKIHVYKETGMKIPNASELCGATGTLTDHGNMVQPLKTV